jgi:hypothetical protein
MKVLYKSLLLSSLFFINQVSAQNNFWTNASESSMKNASQKRLIKPNKFRSLALDTLQLKQFLRTAPMEFTEAARNNPVIMDIPMPDGTVSHFSIVESPIMEKGLAAKFPNIKTYSGQGIEDRTATIKIDWTELGFHAMIFSAVTPSIAIDPYALGNKTGYISYSKVDLPVKPFAEVGVEKNVTQQVDQMRTQSGFCVGTSLRTYRIAVAATGEYTAFFGGTVANGLSAITTTVNRITGVYEKELSVRLVLVANNNTIVYTNAASDPYNPNIVAGQPQVDGTLLNQNQTAIDNAIGAGNYDIGHLVSTIDGGGLAGLGVVCVNGQKARAATGLANPSGDAYDIDYVAHEIGHQFGGNHTFNAGSGSCAGATRNAATAVEPGSGITIMAYAGICTTNNLDAHSIPYFHTISLGEIGAFTNSGSGNNCAVITSTGNSLPVVNAGADYTIPASTPFVLNGSATDANNDALSYSWEEIDPGTSQGNWNSGTKPFFRSFSPTIGSSRTFPKISDIATSNVTIGETVPFSAQTLNFRLTVRDNKNGGGGICSDEMALTIAPSVGFSVTSQSGSTNWTADGSSTANISWNVANTNIVPINCTAVDILFSTDGGLTFPYTLLSNTPNDGSQDIVIPAVATNKGRVMVKARDNIFFNMNNFDITVALSSSVSSACAAEGAVVSPASAVAAAAGSASLNLPLSPQYGSPISISGTITAADPASSLAVFSTTTNGCLSASNVYKYQAYTFIPSISGTYTFTITSSPSGLIENIYSAAFNPASPCTNFLASNGTYNGTNVAIGTTATAILTAGQVYGIAIGTFSNTTPTLPANYSIAVSSSPIGGVLYPGSGVYANPGAGYSYNYVIVDNATNLIKAIGSSANLSSAATYPNGSAYTVYGISFKTVNATTLNSYVGTNFATLTNAMAINPFSLCGNLSKNTVSVNIASVVPVSFLGLKARKQEKKVLLEWSTASELNSDYFELQRSADATNFTSTLGKLNAAGNSSSVKNYAITDAQPLTNWNYYRIKQVDKDGKTAYSNIAAINFEKAAAVVIIYPNPAKDKLNIEYTATKAGNLQLQVMDSKGSLVLTNNASVIAGRNTNSINIAALNSGVYILRTLDADGNINHIKFIKE